MVLYGWLAWPRVGGAAPASEVANKLWSTILTKCPVPGSKPLAFSYFYAGQPDDKIRSLYEYRGAVIERTGDSSPSEADRLNGLQSETWAVMHFSL
jgi:hypothetical protein